MSLHYLLDGYNIIKQVPALAALSLEDGRNSLAQWINVHRPQGSVNNAVTIVFDGRSDIFGGSSAVGLKVIFTSDESADDKIKAIVEAGGKTNYVVVSNDKGIVLYARSLGAKILSVAEFMAAGAPKGHRKTKNGKDLPAGKHISLAQTDAINKEFSKLWLNKP